MGDRTLMGTRSMGGGRSKSVSSMLSQRDKVRMGKQTQEQKREGETGGNRQDKQFLSSGRQGPVMSKSTSNLYSKRQSAETTRRIINGLPEPRSKAEETKIWVSQVPTSPPRTEDLPVSTSRVQKQSFQENKSRVPINRLPRERKKSESTWKSVPRETDLAFRRPSIHQSLININQECEEVVVIIISFSPSFLILCILFVQVIQLMMSLMQEEAMAQFQEITQHL